MYNIVGIRLYIWLFNVFAPLVCDLCVCVCICDLRVYAMCVCICDLRVYAMCVCVCDLCVYAMYVIYVCMLCVCVCVCVLVGVGGDCGLLWCGRAEWSL